MTERTIYLDADRRDWRCRKIQVRASRWFARVNLDRDGYVDGNRTRGQEDLVLPDAYTEAVGLVQNASMDRVRYDGYADPFYFSRGPRWVNLFMPFTYVEAAVEALRSAEMDHDYRGLHTLADNLMLPIDDWLAPGERELVRGIDFAPPPEVFLRFLRGKAGHAGVRLNGRATPGSVWVRPTLPASEKALREASPERYPGWVDRWTEYTDPVDVRWRPWVGGRDQDLSRGSVPVEFRPAKAPTTSACPCGMSLNDAGDDGHAHATHHAAWAFGFRAPRNLDWPSDLAVVTAQSPIAWRKLTSQVGRLPMRENGYDYNSWSHTGEPEQTPDHVRAYLLKANGYVMGYLTAHDTSEHRRWDLIEGSALGEEDATLRPRIILIWVADAYRRQGFAATLVRALADDFGCGTADVSWSTPFSDGGLSLARRISPTGVWIS